MEPNPESLGEEAQLVEADWGGVLTADETDRARAGELWMSGRETVEEVIEEAEEVEGG